jgi:hypothetical protein
MFLPFAFVASLLCAWKKTRAVFALLTFLALLFLSPVKTLLALAGLAVAFFLSI